MYLLKTWIMFFILKNIDYAIKPRAWEVRQESAVNVWEATVYLL